MSLKDLLPVGTYEKLSKEVGHHKLTDKHLIACPICGKKTVYSQANKYRPFCSLRCKYIDLGAWANNERSISDEIGKDDDA